MPDQAPPALDPDDLALIGHLFAKATALLEDAHQIAVEGQRPDLSRKRAEESAAKVAHITSHLGILTKATVSLAGASTQESTKV